MTVNNEFYTNVRTQGNDILYIGYENGERVQEKRTFCPSLYTKSSNPTNQTKTIYGKFLNEKSFDSINEAKEFQRKYADGSNFDLYGQNKWNYQYITDRWGSDDIPFKSNDIRTHYLDIEVYSPNEFPSPQNAVHEITAISVEDKKNNEMHVWYLDKEYGKFDANNLKYIDLDIPLVPHGFWNERDMLMNFVEWFSQNYPDVLTGWYSRLFDIPYLYNRLNNIFSSKFANRLSPWGIIKEQKKNVKRHGTYSEEISYDIWGINEIDYMDLYKKYSTNKRESYKLDFIANLHLGVGKLEFDGTLNQLLFNDYQKYVEYNIIDVRRISQLEDELLYLELLQTVSYAGKVATYSDSLGTVKYWETLIYNYLNENNIQPAIKKFSGVPDSDGYAGAYVKEPKIGMKHWVVSWDYTSLYPSIIRQVNIGPETQLKTLPQELLDIQDRVFYYDENISSRAVHPTLINKEIDLSVLKKYNVSMAANGTFYSNDKQSFLSSLMEKFFNKRKEYQGIMKDYAKEVSEIEDKNSEEYIEKDQLRRQYHTKQLATKILINSAYGGLGNKYFAYYALDNAEAVTLQGQLVIQWIERKINEWMNNMLKTDDVDYIEYIDTDSVTLNMDPIVQKLMKDRDPVDICEFIDRVCEEKISPYVHKCNEELYEYMNNKEQQMFLNREMIADKAVWVGKKRYCMNVLDNEGIKNYEDPYMKIMGIEVVRSSTPQVCRDKLKECVSMILRKDEDTLIEHIQSFRKEFKTLSPEVVAFPRGISDIDKWTDGDTYKKGTPMHVRGSILYNGLIKKYNLDGDYDVIRNANNVAFVYLKIPNPIHENVISFTEEGLFKEFGLHEYVDYNLQFEKSFLDPVKNLTNAIGWKTEKVMTLDI